MRKYIVSVAAIALMSSGAHAATISYGAETLGNLFDGSETLSLPKFDNSMGVLTGVDFALEGGIQGTVRREDTTDAAIGSILSTFTTTIVGGETISVNPESQEGVETGSLTTRVTWGRGTDFDSMTFSGDLSFFEGAGSFAFDVSVLDIIVDADIDASAIDGQADAGTLITYTFEEGITPITPVPLPAAAWMLLAGLGSLWAFRRRTHA